MKILIAASEAVPYVKTGGLGDVAGVLARELAKGKNEVALVLPFHKQIDRSKIKLEICLESLIVKMGDADLFCRVWQTKILTRFTVYFIEYERFFDREPIYNDGEFDYPDNGARFAFLSKASLDLAKAIDFKADVVQANDWQTSLIPFYLKTWDFGGFFDKTASVLSIHNIGYQGHYGAGLMYFLGIQKWQFRSCEFESFGGLNFLKGGVFYADKVSTVSPTYAQEILGEPGGNGLSTFLQRRSDDVVGILNGIDLKEWNPKTDKLLPARYHKDDMSGKAVCKKSLQEAMGLEQDPSKPIFGLVGRLAEQKGLDLLQGCIHEVMKWDVQIALIGSGDPELAKFFGELPAQYPGRFGSYIGFDSRLAHLIEAGSDFFVMPSRYEPCGLNQMYSLGYGTIPIVRATGGLVDTVIDCDHDPEQGTGYHFSDIHHAALQAALYRAYRHWQDAPEQITAMRERGMAEDFSWKRAVKDYMKIYREAKKRRAAWK